ncbi:hypothetical protein HELRODRAFT_190559 [Helobdella robusta]|uniref:Ras-GEF domain-containing protein n=1 Tax=Helobdella robusta TaxID=6412 RepID=T1FS32_HELRO|nr:hypothetical protein HELRODRAFT_190559 [Helobdella robusta]ESO09573.1 hypothetical protein HELRODRAFT_190559 [Helobdella robusta]
MEVHVANNNLENEEDEEDTETLHGSYTELDFSDLANESFTSITVRDNVKDCLEKTPENRTGQDINVLREFLLPFAVFNSFPKDVQTLICRKLVYVVVENEGSIVLRENEEMKYWGMVINGCLEMHHPTDDSYSRLIQIGDWFGIDPFNDTSHTASQYLIQTRVPSCHYVAITKLDWQAINQETHCIEKETVEDGKKVLVVEERDLKKGNKKGYFVKKGTKDQLVKFLVDTHSSEDPTYVEDFLLTGRTFLDDGLVSLCHSLTLWFNDGGRLRDKNMTGQIDLLHRACCVQASKRMIKLSKSTLAESWNFSTVSGKEGGKLFIDNVTTANDHSNSRRLNNLKYYNNSSNNNNNNYNNNVTKTTVDKNNSTSDSHSNNVNNGCNYRDGSMNMNLSHFCNSTNFLMRGDQILEVNGIKVDEMPCSKTAIKIIHESKQLNIIVKYNYIAYLYQLNPEKTDYKEAMISSVSGSIKGRNVFTKQSCSSEEREKGKRKKEWSTRKLFTNVFEPFIKRISVFKDHYSMYHVTFENGEIMKYTRLLECSINLLSLCNDHTRICLVNNNTPIADWLRDITTNYNATLISNSGQLQQQQLQPLQPPHPLWHIKAYEVALELTMRDFQLFKNIQPSEFIEYVFVKKSNTKCKSSDDGISNNNNNNNNNNNIINNNNSSNNNNNRVVVGIGNNCGDIADCVENSRCFNLELFSKLVNREMFWVATEICQEPFMDSRVKLIQTFLKISQHCLSLNNFNSTFCIISGLSHSSVSKLKQTWARVPAKYIKLFQNLQDLMDPSNNMSKYRNLLNIKLIDSPAIPFLPVVMKDLTFIELGNKTVVDDDMVNYDKMRMVARQVRKVTNMASPYYHNKDLELSRSFDGITHTTSTSSSSSSNSMAASSSSSINVSNFVTIRKRKGPAIIKNVAAQLKSDENAMVVKKYLDNLMIICDEEILTAMSNNLEPKNSNSSTSSSSSSKLKLDSSPKAASQDNTGSVSNNKIVTSFKFGTDSQSSINKLINLTEKITSSPINIHSNNNNNKNIHNNTKRPNALSLNSYETFLADVIRVPRRKNSASTVPAPSPPATTTTTKHASRIRSGGQSSKGTLLPAVRLSLESSSVAASPVRNGANRSSMSRKGRYQPANQSMDSLPPRGSPSSSLRLPAATFRLLYIFIICEVIITHHHLILLLGFTSGNCGLRLLFIAISDNIIINNNNFNNIIINSNNVIKFNNISHSNYNVINNINNNNNNNVNNNINNIVDNQEEIFSETA